MNFIKNLFSRCRNTQKYWMFIYFIILFFAVIFTIYKTIYLNEVKNIDQTANELSVLNTKLDKLEKTTLENNLELQKQILQNKKLITEQETLITANKQLEKRIQAHTELLKRMCEYIVVITVDKKITPRQCLADYSWKREEGL